MDIGKSEEWVWRKLGLDFEALLQVQCRSLL